MPPMIKLSNVTVARAGVNLFSDASIAINPGKHIGVIGHNGCGKSSLFQVLLGGLPIDEGDIQVPVDWTIAHMAQQVSASDVQAVDYVLDGDRQLRKVEALIASATESGDDHALAAHYAALESIHGYDARYRAEQLLHGLGFTQDQMNHKVTDFSGGWRIRLNLAQALMSSSDLLLLDEPTNHLDLDATLWLEKWLNAYRGTLLIISHDRDFLDNVVDDIVQIERQTINHYRGNYSQFEVQRAARLAVQQSNYEKQQRRITEIQGFVTRFKAKASKAKQAQSRVKELERMELIAPAHIDSPFRFKILEAKKTSTPLLTFDRVTVGYGDTTIVSKVNMTIAPGDRIGLLGANGAGKSTLVKSLVGDLPLLDGSRVAGEHLAIGYFAQHQLEALDLKASAYQHLIRLTPEASEQQVRDFLGGFAFHGDKAMEPITPFSGGEKARLALAIIVWQKPNLLLLDEPTNHLDLEMRQALTMALQDFSGALVVISHDRHLLRNTVDEFQLIDAGRLTPFDGSLEDYYQWLLGRRVEPPTESDHNAMSGEPSGSSLSEGASRKQQRQRSAELRQKTAPLRKQVSKLEKAVTTAQSRLDDIESQLADPAIYADSQKGLLTELLTEQGQLTKQLEDTEALWLEALEKLEALEDELQS